MELLRVDQEVRAITVGRQTYLGINAVPKAVKLDYLLKNVNSVTKSIRVDVAHYISSQTTLSYSGESTFARIDNLNDTAVDFIFDKVYKALTRDPQRDSP
jgi:hypothetical protein